MDIARIRKKAKKKKGSQERTDPPVKEAPPPADKEEKVPLKMEEVEFPTEEVYKMSLEKGVEEERKQFLTFFLEDEEFAIDVTELKEVIKPRAILEVPNAPPFVKGIISLRGEIVPIIDLRERLGLPPKDMDRQTRFILAGLNGEKVGLIVDRIRQVMRVSEREIEPPPQVREGIDTEFIEGIAHTGERLIAILRLSRVLKLQGTT